jgi:hypothetical protein
MCLYSELSHILFENRENMNDGIYVKCMELLKKDYDNKYSCIFAKYLLKNKESFDKDVLVIMFTIILQDLDRLQEQIDNNKKEQEEKKNKDFIHDCVLLIPLFPIHLIFIYAMYALITCTYNKQIPT